MTIVIPVEEAKSRFDEILERVEQGEEMVLERDGKSVVTMAPSPTAAAGAVEFGWAKGQIELREQRFGTARGMITMVPGWDDPMTEEELSDWYDGPTFPDDETG